MNYCGNCGSLLNENYKGNAKKVCTKCNWKWYDPPVPVVVVFVSTQNNEMLYVRQKWFPENKWATVSGFIDKHESAEEAAVREVKEETGLETRVIENWGTIISKNRPNDLYIMVHCEVNGGKLQAGDDADEVDVAPIDTQRLIEGSIAEHMLLKFLNN